MFDWRKKPFGLHKLKWDNCLVKISEHIGNVFKEGELDEKVVVRKFRTTTQHGALPNKTQEHDVNGYNLDVIISVGYRVKSVQDTQFRIWATQREKDGKTKSRKDSVP